MGSWATAERTYKGFPLHLRRPLNVDTPDHRQKFRDLLTVTHTFDERLPNGCPEPRYNESLEELDSNLCSILDPKDAGVPILIETFGGERNYYFCIAPEADISNAKAIVTSSHPNARLTWTIDRSKGWSFLDRYAREFF